MKSTTFGDKETALKNYEKNVKEHTQLSKSTKTHVHTITATETYSGAVIVSK